MRPSIMSLGRDHVGAGLGVGDRGLRQQLDREVVVDLAVARTKPQWPCEVYSQRQTSVITIRSGCASFSARTAICTMPSSS